MWRHHLITAFIVLGAVLVGGSALSFCILSLADSIGPQYRRWKKEEEVKHESGSGFEGGIEMNSLPTGRACSTRKLDMPVMVF